MVFAKKMKIIHSDRAPKAIGPYSQAVLAGPFLFLSGMLPIDPESGKVVEGIEAQVRQVMVNIGEVLGAAGLGFENVAKMEIFLIDLDHFQTMNAVYASFFGGEHKPARHAFQVAKLPLGSLIEITCTALS